MFASGPGGEPVPLQAVTAELRLLSVHAHPDDEASKGASTVGRYVAEGVEATLVCCTGGEAGDILNPAMDRPEVHANIGAVRREELDRSAAAIGFQEVVMLGYRDSGMPDSPENADPRCFARADEDEAVGRLVAAIRRTRPHVILTYGDEQTGYPHPDHLRVHDISVIAWDAAGDPDRFLEAGEPWTPSKLYYSTWARARFTAMHEAFLANDLESPFDQKWFDRPSQDHKITTRIDITGYYSVRSAALRAHATQIDPDERFWFGLTDEIAEAAYPFEDYELAGSRVPTEVPEDDLFAGLRDGVAS
ncbi:MAG: Mycothiol conjugate amidase Mca [Ilumatobacteraceae bacterium]|nr:Mycothiol conjugate amidase Mca [Ilumatobacteraceae bacterium]